MKKLLISLLIGSIFIGTGFGVLFLEIGEYSFQEYRQDLSGETEHIYTEKFENSLDNLNSKQLALNGYAGRYHRLHGSIEVTLDKSVARGFEVDVYYKGEQPQLSYHQYVDYDNDDGGYDSSYNRKFVHGQLNIITPPISPSEFIDIAMDVFQSKVFFNDPSSYIVEKIVIRTAQPEKIVVDF